MKFLYVCDKALMEQMVAYGYRMLHQNYDIERNQIWVFENNPDASVCFDINDTSVRGACVASDELIMRF